MITYFLGREQVDAYAVDLVNRLLALGEEFPTTWFLLGISGQNMAEVISRHIPDDVLAKLKVVRVACDRTQGEVEWQDPFDDVDLDKPVLLLDSAIHSGHTMLKATRALADIGAKEILTYSLVIKAGSELVPNYFGVIIGDHDRAYFLLNSIPNNRLQKTAPFGVLRVLQETDIGRTFPRTGVPSMDKISFSDLMYEKTSRGSHVYVYEHGKQLCGYVSFERRGGILFIDGLGSDQDYRGRNIGGLLMRWAENWARSHKCDSIELWALEPRIPFYRHMHFVEDGRVMNLGEEVYHLMRRRLLYNVKPEVA